MSADTVNSIALEHHLSISVDRYHQMIDTGVLTEQDRVELIEGVIVAVSPQSREHVHAVEQILRVLMRQLGREWAVRSQAPLTLARSEPEPDVAVVPRALVEAAPRHPTTASLVVEVARSSLALDQAMAPVYAEAGITEYWIVDVENRCVHVYTGPSAGSYASSTTATDGDELRPTALPPVSLEVSDLFAARH